MVPPLLFVAQEAPQSLLGCAPFDLMYGYLSRGLLDLVKEGWETRQEEELSSSVYVQNMQQRLWRVGALAHECLKAAQQSQKAVYDKRAQERGLRAGQKVLVLLPNTEIKLMKCWQGPFVITHQMGPIDYEIVKLGSCREKEIYHVNLVKEWREQEGLLIIPLPLEDEFG